MTTAVTGSSTTTRQSFRVDHPYWIAGVVVIVISFIILAFDLGTLYRCGHGNGSCISGYRSYDRGDRSSCLRDRVHHRDRPRDVHGRERGDDADHNAGRPTGRVIAPGDDRSAVRAADVGPDDREREPPEDPAPELRILSARVLATDSALDLERTSGSLRQRDRPMVPSSRVGLANLIP